MQSDDITFPDAKQAEVIAKATYPDAQNIRVVEHGYDNIVVLVDDLYALRFPRNEDAYARSQYEKQVLQHLETLETINVPRILGEHVHPPYLLTSFVAGEHLSPKDINNFPVTLQEELGKSVAEFAYSMHTAFSIEEARRIRKKLQLDSRAEEPWDIYFERLLSGSNLLTPEQDIIAKKYYAKWKKIDAQPLVVVHDDLHTENMLFKDNRLCGVLDFGDTNIGTAEQDLRQLYRINETILNAAANRYAELSGRHLNVETIKLWAIMQELASYAERLLTKNTNHHAFARASGNLNMWLKTDIWGKGLVRSHKAASYQ
jgi:aminoglycoside phosphotransferase (APT) family kinase protein